MDEKWVREGGGHFINRSWVTPSLYAIISTPVFYIFVKVFCVRDLATAAQMVTFVGLVAQQHINVSRLLIAKQIKGSDLGDRSYAYMLLAYRRQMYAMSSRLKNNENSFFISILLLNRIGLLIKNSIKLKIIKTLRRRQSFKYIFHY